MNEGTERVRHFSNITEENQWQPGVAWTSPGCRLSGGLLSADCALVCMSLVLPLGCAYLKSSGAARRGWRYTWSIYQMLTTDHSTPLPPNPVLIGWEGKDPTGAALMKVRWSLWNSQLSSVPLATPLYLPWCPQPFCSQVVLPLSLCSWGQCCVFFSLCW